MNLLDVQQVQTVKSITKLNGKDMPTTGVNNFASLLQYLTQVATDGSTDVLQEQSVRPADSLNEAEVEQLVLKLANQPEQVLQLLEQPNLKELIQDPQKTTELIQFLKMMQNGKGEQALELLQQLSPAVQQAIVVALTSVVGVTREEVLPKGNNVPVVTPAVRPHIEPKGPRVLKTVPLANPPIVTDTGQKMVDHPVLNRPVLVDATASIGKKWIEGGKHLESTKMNGDPEGKEPLNVFTGLKTDRLTFVPPTLARNPVLSTNVDEQLANRIEAALKQAPFLKGADGSTRMSIRLYPEQLGEVVVQLDRKEGLLTVKLFAATEQVKQLMDQQLGKLQTSLQQQAPLVKVETGLLASNVKEFEQGLPQERRERQPEEPVPHEEELEEDEDD